jgi:peptidoglycan hydrolase CwlO-like protein
LSAVLLVGALGLLPLVPQGSSAAAANPIDAKRAEAARIAAQLDAGAQRVADVAAQSARAQGRLHATEAALARASSDLQAADARYGGLKSRLANQAVQAYVHGGSAVIVDELTRSNGGNDLALRNRYASLAAGQDRQAIDDLIAARQDLGTRRAALDGLGRQQRAQVDALAAQQAALVRAENAEQALFSRVRGELASLVAAEQARRIAALAAAARRRAAAPTPGPWNSPGGTWACIRQLESGNNYSSPGGGAYQFEDGTWHSLGYSGTASDAPPAQQDQAAIQLQQRSGWSQWTTAPRCGV